MRISDWSSDVCSSDLRQARCGAGQGAGRAGGVGPAPAAGRGGRMIERLEVELFGQPVGALAISGPLRSPEDWTFAYRRDYLQSGAPALSVTMPLREAPWVRSEEHTSELQSLMRISYAVFCLKKKTYQID